jgi:hypothetical protein
MDKWTDRHRVRGGGGVPALALVRTNSGCGVLRAALRSLVR